MELSQLNIRDGECDGTQGTSGLSEWLVVLESSLTLVDCPAQYDIKLRRFEERWKLSLYFSLTFFR